MKKLDLIGRRFGKLVVQSCTRHSSRIAWLCKCDCGGVATVITSNLTRGNSTRCVKCGKGRSLRTHGRYKHPAYNSWRSMIQRCNNKKSSDYPQYGGRGVTICDEWLDIENFIKDMGEPPNEGDTIERLDVNDTYSANNCIWASRKVQASNKRNTLYLDNETVIDICTKHNLPYAAVYHAVRKGKDLPYILHTYTGRKCVMPDCIRMKKYDNYCAKHRQ